MSSAIATLRSVVSRESLKTDPLDDSLHGLRTAMVAIRIGRQMDWDVSRLKTLARAARHHDDGKKWLPAWLIEKRSSLSTEERAVMADHTTFGHRALLAWCPVSAQVALLHHERWDGSGYPFGLSGDRIPIEARIVAVADVLDALLSERTYKPAWQWEEALDYLRAGAGTQFDPTCIAALERCLTEVRSHWHHCDPGLMRIAA